MDLFKGTGGNEADGMRYVSLMIAAVLIPLSFWWTFKLKEPGFKKVEKQQKSPFWQDMKRTASNRNFIMLTLTIFTLAMGFNFVSLLGSYIPIFYIFGGDKVAGATLLGINGTVWAVTGLLAVFPLNWVSPKLGKRNTLILAIVLMILAQVSKIFCYNPDYPYLIIIPTVLLSAGMLFFFTLGSSMVGDICDEDELHTGKRSEGSYYSVFWWFIKMGTALASFVAGVLIVYTAFDEVQVTKVDSLQGSIKELHSAVKSWSSDKSTLSTADYFTMAQSRTAETRNELTSYQLYIDKERQKKFDHADGSFTTHPERKKLLDETSNKLSTELIGLGLLESQLKSGSALNAEQQDSLFNMAVSYALRSKLHKCTINAAELKGHLQMQVEKATKNKEHYESLIVALQHMQQMLAGMTGSESLQIIDSQLSEMEKDIFKLTVQGPYTLWMMRVVEIGLPILLSIFSVIFAIRYSLTEKRSYEIKALIAQRNAMQEAEQMKVE